MPGVYATIPPISSSSNGFAQPITALSFDPVSDILWAGLNSGVVTAYLGRQSVRGPCFRIGGSLSVKKMIAGDNHVLAADNANKILGSWTKGGVNKWHFRSV
jgi:PAB-dependent poly(A)-specific ribonuclease subunit 2